MEVFSGDDDFISLYYSDNRNINDSYYFTVKPTNSTMDDDSDALLKINPEDITFIKENTIVVIPVNKSTVRIPFGTYRYDIQRIDTQGRIKTIISGIYKVINDTTKRISEVSG